ncbi:nuclear transport factor 2 family protein [Streptomyces cinereospinus]|uniref:Nuclear transport factor 2 family protein n=1 Tax=Streptomyces cinereospinus TaxID=285561 RepID=A0ABV5N770_9ACTN
MALTTHLLTLATALWFEVDHTDGTGVSAFFTADAELRFGTRSFHGSREIDHVYASRTARGPRVSRHLVTNLHVTSADTTHATAVSNLLLFAEDGEPPRSTVTPAVVSDVVDDFVLRDGSWLIRSRHITTLFAPPDIQLAVPTH